MVQLSVTKCSCIAILWVSLVSFAAINLCVASRRMSIVVIVYFVIDSVQELLDTPSYLLRWSIYFLIPISNNCANGIYSWPLHTFLLLRLLLILSSLLRTGLTYSLCFIFNWAPRHGGVLGECRYSSTHFYFGTRRREVAALPPGKEPPIPIGYEVGWAPEPVWTRWWKEIFPAHAGTRSPSHLARSPALYHWAIPGPLILRLSD
jgi:hypothetical protein